jgi:DNA mismatch repair protein MutL
MLHDLLTEAFAGEAMAAGDDLRDRLVASSACHGSVRAGEALDARGMARVVEDLYRCRNPFHCIHGRPTVVTWEMSQLDKMFKRTGPG